MLHGGRQVGWRWMRHLAALWSEGRGNAARCRVYVRLLNPDGLDVYEGVDAELAQLATETGVFDAAEG